MTLKDTSGNAGRPLAAEVAIIGAGPVGLDDREFARPRWNSRARSRAQRRAARPAARYRL